MIGERIEVQPGVPWGAAFFFLIGAGLAILAGAVKNIHPAIGAILPLAIGLALLLSRPKRFSAEMTETAIELHDPSLTVPYDTITGIVLSGKPTQAVAPLYVFHGDEVIAFPQRLNVPSNDLYAFLTSRLAPGGARDVPAALVKYLRQQEEQFGPERVYSYRARRLPTPHPRWRRVAVSLGIAAAGAAWFAIGLAGGKSYEPWTALGALLAVMCGLFAFGFAVDRRSQVVRNWRQSGLVIGPIGLAMVQGDVRGEMRWGELRKLDLRTKARTFRLDHAREPINGIRLVFEGATVIIADLYDRPLPLIFERIREYWQGPEANA